MASPRALDRLRAAARRRPWLAAVVWAAAILGVSSMPVPPLGPPLFPGCDKVLHFIEYSVLGTALRFWSERREAGRAGSRPRGRAGGSAPRLSGHLLAGIAFGAADEIHQRLIPGRTMSFWDFTADACGVLCGYFLVLRAARCRRPGRSAETD
ncbi:MAG: VanZ family protein [bacterium]